MLINFYNIYISDSIFYCFFKILPTLSTNVQPYSLNGNSKMSPNSKTILFEMMNIGLKIAGVGHYLP